jgi:glycosyltransferase involved in cell wall biosynthesis
LQPTEIGMSLDRPSCSIIVPWADYPELAITLRRNLQVLEGMNAEFLVVNCGGNSEEFRRCASAERPPMLRMAECNATRFNKSLALNLGVSIAAAEWLFLLDADIVISKELIDKLMLQRDYGHFTTIRHVISQDSQRPTAGKHQHRRSTYKEGLRQVANIVELTGLGGERVYVETSRVDLERSSRSAPGLVWLPARNFVEVGGMNSTLIGWGWEDIDLLVRLQFVLGMKWKKIGTAIHLNSSPQVPAAEVAERRNSNARNYATCLRNYSVGHWKGTYYNDRLNSKIWDLKR